MCLRNALKTFSLSKDNDKETSKHLPQSGSPNDTIPRMTSLPSTLPAVSPPPLSPLQLSATMALMKEYWTRCSDVFREFNSDLEVFPMMMLVSPAAQIWLPVMSQKLLHALLSVTVTGKAKIKNVLVVCLLLFIDYCCDVIQTQNSYLPTIKNIDNNKSIITP